MNFPNPKTAVAIEELFDELRVPIYERIMNGTEMSQHEVYALIKEQHELLWQAIMDKNDKAVREASLALASLAVNMYLR